MKTNILQNWQGFYIQIIDKDNRKLYVRSIRNNRMKLSLDYSHARSYTKATAINHAYNIEKDRYIPQ